MLLLCYQEAELEEGGCRLELAEEVPPSLQQAGEDCLRPLLCSWPPGGRPGALCGLVVNAKEDLGMRHQSHEGCPQRALDADLVRDSVSPPRLRPVIAPLKVSDISNMRSTINTRLGQQVSAEVSYSLEHSQIPTPFPSFHLVLFFPLKSLSFPSLKDRDWEVSEYSWCQSSREWLLKNPQFRLSCNFGQNVLELNYPYNNSGPLRPLST